MEDTLLVSQIPEDYPTKLAIERAVKDAFARLPGGWKIKIRRAKPRSFWWGFLEVDGPKMFHRVIVLKTPDEVPLWVEHDFAQKPD